MNARPKRSVIRYSILLSFLLAAVAPLSWTGDLPPETASPAPESGASTQNPEIGELLERGDRQVIPILEKMFEDAEEKSQKQEIAVLLVQLDFTGEKYFQYLAGFARNAVDSRTPFPLNFDGYGRAIWAQFNEEFLAWCSEHQVDPDDASSELLIEYPTDIIFLGRTGDSRGYDLLIKGLGSPNPMVVVPAAQGLAHIGDPRAIKSIQETVPRSPVRSKSMLAQTLLYFDDDGARETAREIIGNQERFDAADRMVQNAREEMKNHLRKFRE